MRNLLPSSGTVRLLFAAVLVATGVSRGRADDLFLQAEAGADYAAISLRPRMTNAVPADAQLTLVATDPERGRSTETVPMGIDRYLFENLTVARAVALDGYVTSSGGATTNAASHELFVMGCVHTNDNWLYETAETFTNGTGTGVWSGREYATVSNGLIRLDTSYAGAGAGLVCTVDEVPTPRRGYVVALAVAFPSPNLDLPEPGDQRFGISVAWSDHTTNRANFVYVEHGSWRVVDDSLCNPLVSTNWQVTISVDCVRQAATYYARPSDDAPWTVLGTAADVGAASVTELTARGIGAIAEYRGNGFDTQLLDVTVEFDDESLRPGCNLDRTVVSGTVTSKKVHDTTKTGGTYLVRLTDEEGALVLETNLVFSAEGTARFSFTADGLTSASAYRAEVIVEDQPWLNDADSSQVSVMGRPLTNGLWGVNETWIYENAKTFDGDWPGTGRWTGRAAASTDPSKDWILVKTVSDDDEHPVPDTLSFIPTNVLETTASYVVSFRAVFNDPSDAAEPDEGVFGVTIGESEDRVCFVCMSNRNWTAVDPAVCRPVCGAEYLLTVFVQKELARLHYYAQGPDGVAVELMTVDLDEDLRREFERVDLQGVGALTDLSGSAYSSEFLRIHTDFDSESLFPSTNFEASAVSGVVRFERLWDTDRTNGFFRIVVRDKNGLIVGQKRVSFHDLQDCDFEYYVTGLVPGEAYTVDVVAEVKGFGSDDATQSGSMARIVTNDLWATEGWIRENADTFAGRAIGSGVWDIGDHLASETNGIISINTTLGGEDTARVHYLATNALPEHTGFEMRSDLFFDTACTELPNVPGEYGCALVFVDPEVPEERADFQLVVISNGVWTVIGRDVYEPYLGTEYQLTVRVDLKTGKGYYAICCEQDVRPIVILDFDVAEKGVEPPCHANFRGVGRVRTYEGDGFDVTLVKVQIEFDPATEVPGTNFTGMVASGVVRIQQIWLTDRDHGQIVLRIRDAHGRLVYTAAMSYDELKDHDFKFPVEGLDPGGVYDIEVSVTQEDEVVAGDGVVTKTARPIGGWIHETAETFAGEEPGTGLWTGTNETACVIETESGRAIWIDVPTGDDLVVYNPTNETPSVRLSTIREVETDLRFGEIGWLSYEAPPGAPTNVLAGVTVWCSGESDPPAADDYALAVITTNATWCVLDGTRGLLDPASRCSVRVLIDYATGFVRYDLQTATATNRVHQYDFEPRRSEHTTLAFTGSGHIWSVDGDVWDPNLIGDGTNEYADLETAIADTIGQDVTLFPLWWANQLVTLRNGQFTVDDPENMLTVRFPWWYYVEITTNGTIRIYRFNSSNNWIDYARNTPDDIQQSGSLFLVKTPEGLSWIAAQATNSWISGRIELANDIDLTKHNWTPIAGFTGTFDGRGRTIRGLNNSHHNRGVPGGEYMYGPTNGWGRSAYGLFGTATNAALTAVTFSEVAISNLADSVASLAGALAGNCAVSNVTVESGSVFGSSGTVAGLAGYADFADLLTFVGNTNRADVTAKAETDGEGRHGAGLLCVAGPTDPSAPLGTVVVTNNVNEGTVSGTLYDNGLIGGNVAQILVGTTLGARFGDVHLTNNVAAGTLAVRLERSEENNVNVSEFPAVNLASAFWGYDANGTFLTSLDANRYGAVPVDPQHRTARMLSGTYENGAPNAVGLINDEISASLPGSTVTLRNGLQSWGSIRLDRDLTFDLGGKLLYTVYVDSPFVIGPGVHATVRNGEIVVGAGEDGVTPVEPFSGDLTYLNTNGQNLVVKRVDDDFYRRTTVSVNGEPISALWLNDSDLAAILNTSGTVIQLYDGADVEIDLAAGAFKIGDAEIARLNDCYGLRVVPGENDAMYFEVRIADSAAPTVAFAAIGGVSGGVHVTVGNAQPGFWYALQHKETLVSEWMTPPAAEWKQATFGVVTFDSPVDGSEGYFRVIMSDAPPVGSGD